MPFEGMIASTGTASRKRRRWRHVLYAPGPSWLNAVLQLAPPSDFVGNAFRSCECGVVSGTDFGKDQWLGRGSRIRSRLRISQNHRMHQRFKLKPSRYHSTVNGIRVVFTTRRGPNPSRATRYSIQMYTRIPPTLAVATLQPKVKLKHSFWLRLWGDNWIVGNICWMLEVIALSPAPASGPRCSDYLSIRNHHPPTTLGWSIHQHGRQAPLIDKVPDSFLMESRSLPCFVEYVHLTLKCHGMPALISLFLCHTTYRFHLALTSSQFRCYVFFTAPKLSARPEPSKTRGFLWQTCGLFPRR